MKKSAQQRANLRTCASCEWIHTGFGGCPKCGFGTYGARYVYGNAAYRYKRTQEPWLKKKMQSYGLKLLAEIDENLDLRKPPKLNLSTIHEPSL
jgi:hypothetical protein